MSHDDTTCDVVLDFDVQDDIGISIDSAVDQIDVEIDTAGASHAANYNVLTNKPSIEGTVLIGDKRLPEIGICLITEQMIDNMIYGRG